MSGNNSYNIICLLLLLSVKSQVSYYHVRHKQAIGTKYHTKLFYYSKFHMSFLVTGTVIASVGVEEQITFVKRKN
jgi:hypothetical protein